MPVAYPGTRQGPACDKSATEEELHLESQLQKQLEEDVARIFDESIYSDIEVVSGKSKILTHSCILKARTNRFYHKLQSILHVNIEKDTFDEIYSFISDAYTECNIKIQEQEIITYLEDKINGPVKENFLKTTHTEDTDVFVTPTCSSVSPVIEAGFQSNFNSSPSTELTREYYALVPIESNLLEKELKEQEALSNAFQSIIKTQTECLIKSKITYNKPTTLALSSKYISTLNHRTVKKSKNYSSSENNKQDTRFHTKSSDCKIKKSLTKLNENSSIEVDLLRKLEESENKTVETVYSPDSLIADDPSSSSDYLSAAYIISPGVSYISCHSQLNVEDKNCKMDNIFTSSDSGLENTGMLESLYSHKDVTVTDTSLTESALHDFTTDDTNDSCTGIDKYFTQKVQITTSSNSTSLSGMSSERDIELQPSSQATQYREINNCQSTKKEKQRQNEEFVILESSSLSSETGSWESVFPPKSTEKETCEIFILRERQLSSADTFRDGIDTPRPTDFGKNLVQKSPFKSTSCFIDAATLVDEAEENIMIVTELGQINKNMNPDHLPIPSNPVPCTSAKQDMSPNDWSESNDNDDSLEQLNSKDPDSIQKDLSPTIFEMTPITEDSLCANTFENTIEKVENVDKNNKTQSVENFNERETMLSTTSSSNTVFVSDTPHNSIMSLRASALKLYESEESESDSTVVGREGSSNFRQLKRYNESSPIISGGASIVDFVPQQGTHTGSPLTRRKTEHAPILSGAYIPEPDTVHNNSHRKSPKLSSNSSAWVVDMSSISSAGSEKSLSNSTNLRKPTDKICDGLKRDSLNSSLENCYKSRNSVDSDSSERSSQKFFVDLSSLPDKQNTESDKPGEKKNIFSMYIDIGDKSSVKEMPMRLSSSLNTKKNTLQEAKVGSKIMKQAELHPANDCFEKYESLCNDPNISISEIISLPAKTAEVVTNKKADELQVNKLKNFHIEKCSVRTSSSTRASVIHEEPSTETSGDLFVRLSDLDKPNQKSDTLMEQENILATRMTRSIPEHNWVDQSNSSSRSVISSFHSENALSLNRLFPHLKNEFSRSMPGSLSGRTRSLLRLGPSLGDLDDQASDVSEMSSVQSSVGRSANENSTTEDTSQTSSLVGNCQSRLGQDLLRMFLEEIAPDVTVEVSGRRIKAHKCILSSRCQYFAGILSGGWVESAGNIIVLPPFSFNVVHFALCHIYSGVSTIPDSISIVELATIADMLGLEGLKEAIMFTLKAKYCHYFHKPCSVCTAGVLECFPLSSVYGLDDLYRKCIKWITKYFSRVWPTKAFATLPKELLDKCYQQHIINLSIDNFVDTVYGCGITVSMVQNSRWAETVTRVCRRLVHACAQWAAPRLADVLRALPAAGPPAAGPPAAGPTAAGPTAAGSPAACPPAALSAARAALRDCLAAAIEWAPPAEACRAYAYLSATLNNPPPAHHHSKPDLISNGNQKSTQNDLMSTHASSWRLQCEGALVRAAPRVVGTQAFKELPAELRKRLRELGCIMYGAQALPNSSHLQEKLVRPSYYNRNTKSHNNHSLNARSADIDQVRASFVPYAQKPPPIGSVENLKSNNDLRDKKINRTNPKVRTTKAQEERAKFNLTKNTTSKDRIPNRYPVPRVGSYDNTKSRYLTTKTCKDGDNQYAGTKKLAPKMISSSESSRNSSPIQARNLRNSRVKTRSSNEPAAAAHTMSQDSLATSSRPRTAEPSTDSLTDSYNTNKYATYTKVKHATKGSTESVRPSRSQQSSQLVNTNKQKTKIPVYLNIANRHNNGETRHAYPERKGSGSLMNATKSSSAKMVPKIVKKSQGGKNVSKQTKKVSGTSQGATSHNKPSQADIPVMERSGTFLKDEPTFGDKTTNIDIDQ